MSKISSSFRLHCALKKTSTKSFAIYFPMNYSCHITKKSKYRLAAKTNVLVLKEIVKFNEMSQLQPLVDRLTT